MADAKLQKSITLKLFGVPFSSYMMWQDYTRSIAKFSATKVGSYAVLAKFFTREFTIYIYMYSIRPCFKDHCCAWSGTLALYLVNLYKISRIIVNDIGPDLECRHQSLH